MKVERIKINPTYKKDNGVWVLHTQTIPMKPDFHVVEQSIVYIPPKKFGGNHKHPRQEAFIGIGKDLRLLWQDEKGNIHKEVMNDSDLYLFFIPSFVPHTVYNESHENAAILYEYANQTQHDVEAVHLL